MKSSFKLTTRETKVERENPQTGSELNPGAHPRDELSQKVAMFVYIASLLPSLWKDKSAKPETNLDAVHETDSSSLS